MHCVLLHEPGNEIGQLLRHVYTLLGVCFVDTRHYTLNLKAKFTKGTTQLQVVTRRMSLMLVVSKK